jgi:predicted GNAT family N-acyltransferase
MRADHDTRFIVRTADWQRDAERLRAIRIAVFVIEQNVPEELEWDGIDPDCAHVLAEDRTGTPIGCGRLLPDGHIGRMAVLSEWRGAGVGAALLARLVGIAEARGDGEVLLNAQTHAVPFYTRFGFVPEGPEFEEAGIPHQTMRRALSSSANS